MILFCIDCSESMLELRNDPAYEEQDVKTCHLFTALEAAMQIQKKKVIVGPNDAVGILLFNTVRSFRVLTCCLFRHVNLFGEVQKHRNQSEPRLRNQEVHVCVPTNRTYKCAQDSRTNPIIGWSVAMSFVSYSLN